MRDLKAAFLSLGSVSRLRIVERLGAGGEITVMELARDLRISQPLLSWHLNNLRRAGIVNTRREGRVVRCSLDRERVRHCVRALQTLAGESPDSATAIDTGSPVRG